jgi:hypothetical protein
MLVIRFLEKARCRARIRHRRPETVHYQRQNVPTMPKNPRPNSQVPISAVPY